MTTEKINFYLTTDLSEASVLALYFPLLELLRTSDARKLQFAFEKSEKLTLMTNKYWNKELKVEPRAYFDSLKAIKGRMYNLS